MSYEMVAVPFAPKTVVGAARNLNELIRILESELVTAGFSPKRETDSVGNFFKLKAGFGTSGKVYYRAVGNDVILTPEAKGSSWVWLLCCIGLCPGLIGLMIRDKNVRKVIRRLPTVLEATNSNYKAQFPPYVPAYQPPPAPVLIKSVCVECGQKMTITSEGVFFMGAGEPNIVKLRCERCDITRFEKKADIERELGRTLPREFTLTPQQYQLPEAPKPPETPSAKKYCAYCGAEMRVEAVFCPRCGRRQAEEEVEGTGEAEAHFKKGVAILDEGISLLPGLTMYSSGVGIRAAEEFKKVTELVPSSADYHHFYAVALRWGLQFKSAEEEIKKVLEIDPNHFEAKKTVEYGIKWKDAFSYPKWSETSTSLSETLKPLLPELRPGLPGGTRVVIVRDGARKVVSFLNKSLRNSWYRPLSMDMKMKIELVHSKTPYGSIIASYLVVGDDPTRPYICEALLNPNKSGHEIGDACMLGQNLLWMFSQQDYTYLIFVDENNILVLNKKLVFDAAMRKNLMEIEKALNEVERLGETMELAKFQQAMQWHGNNFPLSNIKL